MNIERIVSFYSGGLNSFLSTLRIKNRFPGVSITCLFTDTLIESPELYQFLIDTTDYLQVRLVKLSLGLTPFELFDREKFLGNSQRTLCSKELKRELAKVWVNAFIPREGSLLVFGYDFPELHRLERAIGNWKPYKVWSGIIDEWQTQDEKVAEVESLGIHVSSAYKLGFGHDNCNGKCIAAGNGHYLKLLRLKPEQFGEQEELERQWRAKHGDHTILKGMTLEQLRLSQGVGIDPNDIGGCGCFSD